MATWQRGAMVLVLATVIGSVIGAGLGCGGDAPPPPREPTPLDQSTTGTISGAVSYVGAAPTMGTLNFGSFHECSAAHQGAVATGDALVRDGTVQNAFVWIAKGLEDRVFAVPTEPVVIDQQGCLYVPRVAGAQVDQAIRFVNSDRTVHNVHGKPSASPNWNVALSRQGSDRTIRVDAPEVPISVRCDLHPWMQGWLGVVDHPYFAVTGPDGAFTLASVPPGEYTVAVWHERFGRQTTTVTLAPSGRARADFALPAR
jgi:plastocyanin